MIEELSPPKADCLGEPQQPALRRPLRQGEARCPNCRWRAAAGWKIPLKWFVRTAGAIASMMIVVFFKGKFKRRA